MLILRNVEVYLVKWNINILLVKKINLKMLMQEIGGVSFTSKTILLANTCRYRDLVVFSLLIMWSKRPKECALISN